MMFRNRGAWIGVDLDGTLAQYNGDVSTIGPPVDMMMQRVQRWLRSGQRIKIFTARAADKKQVKMIQDWCEANGLPRLEVTDRKDYQMIANWDDRAVEVETNTGRPAMWVHNAR